MINTYPQNEKGIRAIMLHVLLTAAAIYVVVLVLMAVLQRHFLYYNDSPLPTRTESHVPQMDEVHFTTEDGVNLFAWTQAPSDAGKPWVVMFHGNAGTIGGRAYKARVFLKAGYGVMMVEYRGYGGNEGDPSEDGLYADARAGLAYLKSKGVSGKKVVIYGESLGTGVAVAAAHEAAQKGEAVAAVLLEAPFTSIIDVAASHYPFLPVSLVLRDRYDSMSRIKAINAPLFVVHGGQDWTVPQKLGRKLYGAAHEPKQALWLDGAGHDDLYDYDVGPALLAFLKAYHI